MSAVSGGGRALVLVIAEFMNSHIPVVKRRSDNTVDSYKTSINLFLDYLAEKRGVTLATITASDLSQGNLTGFMDWLRDERGNSAPTINHRLHDVRGLCRFAESRGALGAVELQLLQDIEEVPDDRAVEFTWLEPSEVRAVLEAVSANRKGLRDNFLLSLLYDTGGRIGEVLSLTVGSLRATGGEADVEFYGKGNKHRITPLSSEVWHRYQAYAAEYLQGAKTSDLVFYVSQHGERHKMSRDNVERMLGKCEKALREGGLPELQHLHTHLFRRSRAMHLYQAGVPLPTIQDWLGHSCLESTRFYAKLTDLMKRDALKKLAESDQAVFKSDTAFKYANDDAVMRRLCGLR